MFRRKGKRKPGSMDELIKLRKQRSDMVEFIKNSENMNPVKRLEEFVIRFPKKETGKL